jgi:hypothetical protein
LHFSEKLFAPVYLPLSIIPSNRRKRKEKPAGKKIRRPSLERRDEAPMTAGGGNFIGAEVKRKGASSTVWSCDH